MTKSGLTENGRGIFSCRIDGRAGYLRLWDDRLELIRPGRRGSALGPEEVPLHLVTQVGCGKPGRLLTAVELVTTAGHLELKLPSLDAPRVAELIATLAEAAEPPAVEPAPPAPSAQAVRPAEIAEPAPVEIDAPFVMPGFDLATEFHLDRVEMPEWTPLPETDLPEMVLSQIVLDELAAEPGSPAPVMAAEPVTEIEPLPEGSVLAAAAALAELEEMLSQVPPAPAGSVIEAADEMVANAREILSPTQPSGESGAASVPSEAVLTLAAAALLGGARPAPKEEITKPRPERPADIPPDLADRLSRLEVLHNCGIMADDDFLDAEAEILESVWSGARSS